MEKKDGLSSRQGSVVKVLLMDDKPSVVVGKEPVHVMDELDEPGAKRAMLEAFGYLNKATERNNLFMNHPPMDFNKPMPLFPSPNSKNSKRRERLNTAAGLPAKRRSFLKHLKKQFRSHGLSFPSADVVQSLWVSSQMFVFSVTFSQNPPTARLEYMDSISGSVVRTAITNGSSVTERIPNLMESAMLHQSSKGTTI